MNIIFLHHSTGGIIWNGGRLSLFARAAKKVSPGFAERIGQKALLPVLFEEFNKEKGRNYKIKEMIFPKTAPYGWRNYPYDYYNIWVKHSGNEPYLEEPTLEILTKDYEVVIFKHCYPVCNIQEDALTAEIDSENKTLSNYKLQYLALREKLHEFPGTKFILFTGAAQVKSNISEYSARRAQEFFKWVTDIWNKGGGNIFLWDLYGLETEGGLYLKDEYAESAGDSHPNSEFAGRAAVLLFNRIIDVIENKGAGTTLKGKKLEQLPSQ